MTNDEQGKSTGPTVPYCRGFDTWREIPCPHPPIDDDGMCLFHSRAETKDADAFQRGVQEKLKHGDCDFRGYRFPAGVTFRRMGFSSQALFNGAAFVASACFLGARFVQGAGFTHTQFHGGAEFGDVVFSGYVSFNAAIFSRSVSFRNAAFHKDVSFQKTQFEAKASFEAAKFRRKTEMQSITFPEEVTFQAAQFGPLSQFANLSFAEKMDCNYTRFGAVTEFNNVKAPKGCSFTAAAFRGAVTFRLCDFGESQFDSAVIGGTGLFHLVHFFGKSNFDSVTAKKEFAFLLVTFDEDTTFIRIRTANRCVFEKCVFKATISFEWSHFALGAEFLGGTFDGDASFRRVATDDDIRFDRMWVSEGCNAIAFNEARLASSQIFDGSGFILLRKDHIVFDLSEARLANVTFRRWFPVYRCRFSGCRGLDEAVFENVDWGTGGKRRRRGWRYRRQAFLLDDEEALKVSKGAGASDNSKIAEVERLYRLLRKSHTARMDAPQTSDFYYGEMEMRRMRPDHGRRRFWETMYWIFGGYGEVWTRPLGWFVALVLVCALFFGLSGLRTSEPAGVPGQPDSRKITDVHIGNPRGLPEFVRGVSLPLLHSFRTAALLGKNTNSEPLHFAGQVVEALETAVGPILLALAALAVRRQFPR